MKHTENAKNLQEVLLSVLRTSFTTHFESDYKQATPKRKKQLLGLKEMLFHGQR